MYRMATVLEMNPKLAALQLALNALGITPEIDDVGARKTIQKAVYLAQRHALDLGYRYGWYKMGPYSPSLAEDYYELARSRAVGEKTNGHRLPEKRAQALHALRSLFKPPSGFQFSQEDWLELLASADYLRRVRKFESQQVRSTVAEQKNKLLQYLDVAEKALAEHGFIE